LIVLALLALIQAPADSLHGMVRVAGTGEGIPGVRVSLRGHSDFAFTDATGLYVLRHLPENRFELQFERLGFQPLTVDVMAGTRGGGVDVDLAPAAVALPPLAVIPLSPPAPAAPEDSAEIGRVRLTKAATRSDPLVGDDDVWAGLAAGQFASGREELTTSLRVRGGSGDENLVLLDGLPWRGPRPPGGVVGMLPSTAVTAVDVHTMVPPVRYGDALSSIVVLQPESGWHRSAAGSVDPTAVEQAVGTPLGRRGGGATLFVSGRQSYRTLWSQADETVESANGFGDAFAHLSAPLPRGAIDLYYLGSKHELAFPARAEVGEADSAAPAPVQNEFLANGSLGGVVWTEALGDERRAQARAWYSEVDGQSTWGPLIAASNLREIGAGADYTSQRIEAGVSLSRSATDYHVQQGGSPVLAMSAAPIIGAVFASRRWVPARAWTVSTGLRLNATRWGVFAEPRAWTRVALGSQGTTSISLGFARVHQYVQSARNDESVVDGLIGGDFPIAAGTGGVPPARSDQLSGSMGARLGARTTVQLEVYGRWLSGLALTPLATRRPFADAIIPIGRGTVWGGDATLTYPADRFDLHLQAGVLSSYRTAGTIRYRTGDARARLAVGLAYHLPRSMVVRLALWAGAGRPTTLLQNGMQLESSGLLGTGELAGSPETVAGPPNGRRLSNYARTDFGLVKSWGLSRGGAPRMTTALTVANLFNRHNVLAAVVAPTGTRPVYLLSRTLSVRVRWYLAR